ncbi:unnamed protein product [Cercospora beticola]|nr:unnamed protein product [Cercospora beticola]
MSTSEASHGAEQQPIDSGHEHNDNGHDDRTANASTSPSLLRSAPLIVDYLAQLRLASFSDDASQMRLNLKRNEISKLESDKTFDAIGQLVIKTNGAFGSATEKARGINLRLHKDEQLVIVRQHYDYWTIDNMETRLDLEAMQNFIKGLATSVNEIKDEFVVAHDIAQEIKSAVVNDGGIVQGQQHETSTGRSQVDQSTSGATIVHDLQIDAQHALESLQKVVQRLDQDPEQPGFDKVGLDALSGLENELSSIVSHFQTLSVQLDGMSEEMTQKMIDLRRSEAVHDRPAAETRDLFMQCARYVDATGIEFSLVEDFMSNFVIPPMQRVESLRHSSNSDQLKEFNKYYRDAMKGYTEATESLAEKSNDDILALLKADISVVDIGVGQGTRKVPVGDQKRSKEETGAEAQEDDDAADDSYGDGPMLGANTEVFGADGGAESEAARELGQSAARVRKMFDNELGMPSGQFDHKVFK